MAMRTAEVAKAANESAPWLAQHPVLPEPGLHLAPGILGRVLAVARAIVGVEAVRCGGIDLELGSLLVFGQRRLEGFHRCDGNAGVGLAIEAEDGRLHLGCELRRALRPDRVLRVDQRTVERGACLQRAAVGGIFPDRATAAAEPDDAQLRSVAALRFGPGNGAVETGQ